MQASRGKQRAARRHCRYAFEALCSRRAIAYGVDLVSLAWLVGFALEVLKQICLEAGWQFKASLTHFGASGFAVAVLITDFHGGSDQVAGKWRVFKYRPDSYRRY